MLENIKVYLRLSHERELLYDFFIQFGVHMSGVFPTYNALEQGDDLSPLLFNYASEYAVRKIQENQQ
jgi:hypothetical protein